MTVWVDLGMLRRLGHDDVTIQIVTSSAYGDHKTVQGLMALDFVKTFSSDKAEFHVNLVSSMIHEKRHFLDSLITNYGAFKFRTFAVYYANSNALLSDLKKSNLNLRIPFDAYSDRVKMLANNIDERSVPRSLSVLAKHFQERSYMLGLENQPLDFENLGSFNVGGDGQLEAIGMLCQLKYIFNAGELQPFGQLYGKHIINDERLLQKYFWWMPFFEKFTQKKMPKFMLSDTLFVAPKMQYLIPILYGALAIRVEEGNETNYGVRNPSFSAARLVAILEEFKNYKFHIADVAAIEIWQYVNSISSKIWGRSVIDEFIADHEKMKMIFKDVQHPCLDDYCALREKALYMLETNPAAIVDVELFESEMLPKIDPIIIFCDSNANQQINTEQASPIFEYKKPNEPEKSLLKRIVKKLTKKYTKNIHYVFASTVNEQIRRGFLQKAELFVDLNDNWKKLIAEVAPMAKLAFWGLKYPSPLLFELRKAELNFSYYSNYELDPNFSPQDHILSAKDLADLIVEAHLECNLCREQKPVDSLFIVSPLYLQIVWQQHFQKNIYENQDWGHNVVCNACRDRYQIF